MSLSFKSWTKLRTVVPPSEMMSQVPLDEIPCKKRKWTHDYNFCFELNFWPDWFASCRFFSTDLHQKAERTRQEWRDSKCKTGECCPGNNSSRKNRKYDIFRLCVLRGQGELKGSNSRCRSQTLRSCFGSARQKGTLTWSLKQRWRPFVLRTLGLWRKKQQNGDGQEPEGGAEAQKRHRQGKREKREQRRPIHNGDELELVPNWADELPPLVLWTLGLFTPKTNWNSSQNEWTNCYKTFQWQFVCSIQDKCQFVAGMNGP